MKKDYLEMMRKGEPLGLSHLLFMTIKLSIPTILAQISIIIMEFADAAMVGRLGGNATASIGLVATSTWLFGGMLNASNLGFSVQVSQYIGAGDERSARRVMKLGLISVTVFSSALALIGAAIHAYLPQWLGGEETIVHDASMYFLIFCLSLPITQFNSYCASMLQAGGNMRTPGILEVLMCFMNIGFNYIFIFVLSLGVSGAALGTALSELVIAVPMGFFLYAKAPMLKYVKGEKNELRLSELKRAVKIAIPVAFEQAVMCSAQITATKIVAPLGSVSIAANSLAVTAESLCYMPGYGICVAASTMTGQSIGAKRDDIRGKLSWITVGFGMAVMTVTGVGLFVFSDFIMQLLTPVKDISSLGAGVLRIEAFAEPLFAASIVASGVFRGAGDTFVPSIMNLFSMWAVRIPLSAFLAPRLGLRGVWIAMCIELCVRGALFLIRLYIKTRKLKKPENGKKEAAVSR